jgi:GH43 family beta-xylosidase
VPRPSSPLPPRPLAPLAALILLAATPGQAAAEPPRYQNPIVRQQADPWVFRHTDGWYYFTASVPEYDRIEIRRARTVQGLGEALPVVAWRRHESGVMSANIWAPEIHFIGGSWYIYFAAARSNARFDHRIYILENDSPDPFEGQWVEKGRLDTGWSSFSLDATTFAHRGARYLVWAQRDHSIPGNSNLYIALMASTLSLAGPAVRLSRPEYTWETQGFMVNEGPAVLIRNGRVFLTYSASATDSRYCMGMLTAEESADLLNSASWKKSSMPVFQTDPSAGVFGPGHNSFTVEEGYDILVYHARSYRDIAGDPLFDPNRDTRAQPIGWNADGTPRFEPAQ